MTTGARGRYPVEHLRATGLTRAFADQTVLDGIDLEIRPGEFVALLGRSGSGKTTLLRVLAGLDDGATGTLDVPASTAVVFQESRLLPWKRVHENVSLGLSGGDLAARAARALEEVELAHRSGAWPLTLSGGEAARVGLARAVIREPALLLLDEPFAALDALTRLRMQDLVLRLLRHHGSAALLVTHDVDEAIRMADRVLILDRGRIATEIRVDRNDRTLRDQLLRRLGVELREVAA